MSQSLLLHKLPKKSIFISKRNTGTKMTSDSKKMKFPAFGIGYPPIIEMPQSSPEETDFLALRYDHFYGAIYNYILNFFSIGYTDDKKSGCFITTYSIENETLTIHFSLKPTKEAPFEDLAKCMDSFFCDMGGISKKFYLDEIEGKKVNSSEHPPYQYILRTSNMPQLIKLFRELEKFYKAENLDAFLQDEKKRKSTVPFNQQATAFRKMASLPDETITDKTCSGIDFFPPITAVSREHAYVVYNRAAWKDRLIPDSLDRICQLWDFAKGKTIHGNGLHFSH
jgi:hypothetical protein